MKRYLVSFRDAPPHSHQLRQRRVTKTCILLLFLSSLDETSTAPTYTVNAMPYHALLAPVAVSILDV